MKNNRSIFGQAVVICLITAFFLSAGVIDACANNLGDEVILVNRVEFGGGYFMNRREEFRDIYGDGAAFSLSFERYWREKFSFRITAGRLKLQDDENTPEYRDLTISATANYTFAQAQNNRFFAGSGFGLSARTINVIVIRGELLDYATEFEQTEYSPFWLIMVGGDIGITGPLYFGMRGMFYYHFGGDPTIGEFGDSGGYTFSGGLGLAF